MILSYAQNLEDHTLAAVFAGEGPGVYIDVGGGHAVADNVTFHFYLQGWRGVVVEPQARLAAAYAGIRPRDIVIGALLGRAEGEADFHEVQRLHGFSTMIEAHARAAAAFGVNHVTRRVPVTTLAALSVSQGLTDIDLLKIDVEGAEADVLAGNDWTRFRPRVLCIEAVSPGAMHDAWQDWEPDLLGHRYAFACFDGLNRFYVAHEASHLLPRFPEQRTDWGVAGHLYDFGRPLDGPRHADHALARTLVDGFLALLPTLDPSLLAACFAAGAQEADAAAIRALALPDPARVDRTAQPLPPLQDTPDAEIAALLNSDAVRAALGRIACFHDGGHIIET